MSWPCWRTHTFQDIPFVRCWFAVGSQFAVELVEFRSFVEFRSLEKSKSEKCSKSWFSQVVVFSVFLHVVFSHFLVATWVKFWMPPGCGVPANSAESRGDLVEVLTWLMPESSHPPYLVILYMYTDIYIYTYVYIYTVYTYICICICNYSFYHGG